MALTFKQCKFILSATNSKHYPKKELPIIAVAGRSNVGKSSLINHLFNKKNLAKTSSVPGKTAHINFFSIDEEVYLVDLPGYGFAKKSKGEQNTWSRWILEFIEKKIEQTIFIVLIDSRHPPFPKDLELISWLSEIGKKPLVVFTKTDKLKRKEKKKLKALPEELLECKTVNYSIKNSSGKQKLINTIKESLANGLFED